MKHLIVGSTSQVISLDPDAVKALRWLMSVQNTGVNWRVPFTSFMAGLVQSTDGYRLHTLYANPFTTSNLYGNYKIDIRRELDAFYLYPVNGVSFPDTNHLHEGEPLFSIGVKTRFIREAIYGHGETIGISVYPSKKPIVINGSIGDMSCSAMMMPHERRDDAIDPTLKDIQKIRDLVHDSVKKGSVKTTRASLVYALSILDQIEKGG